MAIGTTSFNGFQVRFLIVTVTFFFQINQLTNGVPSCIIPNTREQTVGRAQ